MALRACGKECRFTCSQAPAERSRLSRRRRSQPRRRATRRWAKITARTRSRHDARVLERLIFSRFVESLIKRPRRLAGRLKGNIEKFRETIHRWARHALKEQRVQAFKQWLPPIERRWTRLGELIHHSVPLSPPW